MTVERCVPTLGTGDKVGSELGQVSTCPHDTYILERECWTIIRDGGELLGSITPSGTAMSWPGRLQYLLECPYHTAMSQVLIIVSSP